MQKESQSISFFSRYRRKLIVFVIMALLLGLVFWRSQAPKTEEPRAAADVIENSQEPKAVESLVFGAWAGGGSREVLATVESLGDVTLTAELSGTINQVYVNIGDSVYRGQVLARYERGNDQTFINYQNAVSSLEQAKITNQNAVTQAEIALNNARAEFQRQKNVQDQVDSQSFVGLESASITAQTNIVNAINWADNIVQGSAAYQYSANGFGNAVGRNNTVLRQQVREKVRQIQFEIPNLGLNFSTQEIALSSARTRLNLLERTRSILIEMDSLIRQTTITASFPASAKSSFEQQVEGFKASIDGQRTALSAQISGVGSQGSQSSLALEQSQNRITTAQANLELAKANAAATLNASENSVGLASSSVSDLDVRSPFAGTITEKFINDFQQVSPGIQLFSLVNSGTAPKIIAFVSKTELDKLLTATEVTVILDDQEITVSNAAMSTKVDSATQKIKVEYELPTGGETLVGSLGRLQIPSSGTSDILLPLTAVSFEPDGAEVMVITDGVVTRKKVIVGEIVSGGIEVLDGLVVGDKIVQYRSRVFVGEKVTTH